MYTAYTNRPIPGCTVMQTARLENASTAYSRFREAAFHTLYVPYTTINVILEGQKRMYDGRAVYHLHAGDILLIPRDSLVCSEILPGGFESLNLQVPDALLARILAQAPAALPAQKTVSLSLQMTATWQQYALDFLQYTRGKAPLSTGGLQEQLQALLWQQPDMPAVLGMLKAAQAAALGPAIRAAGAELEDIRQLGTLAGKSCMSRASLQRHFHRRYRCTPMAWLWEQRVCLAGFLLRTTAWPIREVAYYSGFEDVTHFYRVFRQQFGATPAQWRAGA
ncbi:MAG TPA: AraC family transcriptional regulator [Chitinophaga sp.]